MKTQAQSLIVKDALPLERDATAGETHLRLLISPAEGDGFSSYPSAQEDAFDAADMLRESPQSGSDGLSAPKLRSIMGELCSAIRSALDDERVNAEDCLRRASQMLQDSVSETTGSKNRRGGLCLWQIRKVTSYIDLHLAGSIRNEDLAALVRLHPSHFARSFRASVGEPPHAYVMRRRVERAQGLMLSTTEPLSEIALNCGLADQSHLTRLFSRHVGESPSVWRRARLTESVACGGAAHSTQTNL